MDIIETLIQLQRIDRKRDRLQKKLDEVPVKLKRFTDAIASFEAGHAEQASMMVAAKAEADRAELEVKSREEDREKIKRQMNAPKLSNREYETLQEMMAGTLADINSLTDTAIKAMQRAGDAEAKTAEIRAEKEKISTEYAEAKAKLEGSLAGVTDELAQRDAERDTFLENVGGHQIEIYNRVRKKHNDALAILDGTIDAAAGRIGNDLHCSACYISIPANYAVRILGRKELLQCKSCARILYVP